MGENQIYIKIFVTARIPSVLCCGNVAVILFTKNTTPEMSDHIAVFSLVIRRDVPDSKEECTLGKKCD